MNIARLVKIAPTLLLVAFLAYAAYSIQVSLSIPAATRSGWSRRTPREAAASRCWPWVVTGLMLPIRGEACYRDRSDGDRLGPRSEGTAIGDGVPEPDAPSQGKRRCRDG